MILTDKKAIRSVEIMREWVDMRSAYSSGEPERDRESQGSTSIFYKRNNRRISSVIGDDDFLIYEMYGPIKEA